jgi:uncharacterized SAM-binding protein YcdF (DUF218 family)
VRPVKIKEKVKVTIKPPDLGRHASLVEGRDAGWLRMKEEKVKNKKGEERKGEERRVKKEKVKKENDRNRAKMVMRIILAAVGILGIIWFSLPVPLGVVNIGNITGLVVSALFLALAVLIDIDIVKKVLSLILIVSVCSAMVLSALIIHAAAIKPEENATAIVLGCRVYGETPSLMLVKRLEAAYDYLKEHPGASCVLSGGKGPGEDISEAECMYRWLLKKGVDAGRLYKEDRSESTRENLAFSEAVISEEGLPESVAIVTDSFHLYRAGSEAQKLGLRYGSVPGKTPWWLLPTFLVREYYAIIYHWIV